MAASLSNLAAMSTGIFLVLDSGLPTFRAAWSGFSNGGNDSPYSGPISNKKLMVISMLAIVRDEAFLFWLTLF